MDSTRGKSKKAFVVPLRTVFDYVATRDLGNLKMMIAECPNEVIDARDESGFSALHVACGSGHVDVTRALLGQDCAAADNALIAEATGKKNLASSARREPKPREGGHRRSERKETKMDPTQLPVPVTLPALELDVNVASHLGVTPLHLAAARGDLPMVRLLLEAGADPRAISSIERCPFTPYQLARRGRHTDVELLLESLTLLGADVTDEGAADAAVQYVQGQDPLQAAEEGNLLYFGLALLDCATDAAVDPQRYAAGQREFARIREAKCAETGQSVLMVAANRDLTTAPHHASILKLLLQPVVFVRAADRSFEDSLESVFVGCPRMPAADEYKLPRKESAAGGAAEAPAWSINSPNAVDGTTVLHIAAKWGNAPLVMALLEAGADPLPPTGAVKPIDLCVANAQVQLLLTEAAARKRFLTLYNRRNEVPPDDRADFQEEAKRAKREWRVATESLALGRRTESPVLARPSPPEVKGLEEEAKEEEEEEE